MYLSYSIVNHSYSRFKFYFRALWRMVCPALLLLWARHPQFVRPIIYGTEFKPCLPLLEVVSIPYWPCFKIRPHSYLVKESFSMFVVLKYTCYLQWVFILKTSSCKSTWRMSYNCFIDFSRIVVMAIFMQELSLGTRHFRTGLSKSLSLLITNQRN